MPTTKDTGILSKRCDNVINKFVFVDRFGLLVRDVHAIAAGKPDA